MKEESLLLLSDLQKLINQVVLIDYTIIILGRKDNGNRSKQGYRPLSGIGFDWNGSRVCAGGSGCGCL